MKDDQDKLKLFRVITNNKNWEYPKSENSTKNHKIPRVPQFLILQITNPQISKSSNSQIINQQNPLNPKYIPYE